MKARIVCAQSCEKSSDLLKIILKKFEKTFYFRKKCQKSAIFNLKKIFSIFSFLSQSFNKHDSQCGKNLIRYMPFYQFLALRFNDSLFSEQKADCAPLIDMFQFGGFGYIYRKIALVFKVTYKKLFKISPLFANLYSKQAFFVILFKV